MKFFAKQTLISPTNRFSAALLFAVTLHATVILGVQFSAVPKHKLAPPSLEVVLVQAATRRAPDEPKYIAQANQQASGSTDIKDRPSDPLTGATPLPTEGIAPFTMTTPTQANLKPLESLIISRAQSPEKFIADEKHQPDKNVITKHQSPLDQRELEIAQLTAELADSEKRYAERPRINFIDTLSAKTAVEAAYIKAWVEKVEHIGNLNYPDEARRRKLNGALILHVLLDNNGKVLKVRVGSPSGQQVLDDAAVRIVKLASPFDRFPNDMREAYDQLMITRTWVFQAGTALKTQ
jgi:periplasmic protein TonB